MQESPTTSILVMVAADSFQSFIEGSPFTIKQYALTLALATVILTAIAVTPAARTRFSVFRQWLESKMFQIARFKWQVTSAVQTRYHRLLKFGSDLWLGLLGTLTSLSDFLVFLVDLGCLVWSLLQGIYNFLRTQPWIAANIGKSVCLILAMMAFLGYATYRTLAPICSLFFTTITAIMDIYIGFLTAKNNMYDAVQWLPCIVKPCIAICLLFCLNYLALLGKKKWATFQVQVPTWIKAKHTACPTSVEEQSTALERTVAEELLVDTPPLSSSERSSDPWSAPTQCMSEQPMDSLRTTTQLSFEQQTVRCPIPNEPSKRRFSFGDQVTVRRRRAISQL